MERKTILIVDDDTKIIELLDRLLKGEGFNPVAATTGQEAIDKAKRYQPQLIIMDIMLPDMNGAEAVLAIKDQGLVAQSRDFRDISFIKQTYVKSNNLPGVGTGYGL